MWFNNECGVFVVELLLWQMPDMCGETSAKTSHDQPYAHMII